MSKHYNPYHLHSGVFVPHYLLSSSGMSHGAKLLYALLASKADSRGEVLLNVALMIAELGEEEHNVFRLMNELDTGRFIHTERHPAGTRFVRCFFPQPAWLTNSGAPAQSHKLSPMASQKPSAHSLPTPSVELLDAPGQPKQEKIETVTQHHFSTDVMCETKSRYSFGECYKYVLACQQVGQRIKSPYRLAKALHKTGEQDEEIALFLATGRKQEHTRAA
jgi:hypothetical protein